MEYNYRLLLEKIAERFFRQKDEKAFRKELRKAEVTYFRNLSKHQK